MTSVGQLRLTPSQSDALLADLAHTSVTTDKTHTALLQSVETLLSGVQFLEDEHRALAASSMPDGDSGAVTARMSAQYSAALTAHLDGVAESASELVLLLQLVTSKMAALCRHFEVSEESVVTEAARVFAQLARLRSALESA